MTTFISSRKQITQRIFITSIVYLASSAGRTPTYLKQDSTCHTSGACNFRVCPKSSVGCSWHIDRCWPRQAGRGTPPAGGGRPPAPGQHRHLSPPLHGSWLTPTIVLTQLSVYVSITFTLWMPLSVCLSLLQILQVRRFMAIKSLVLF